MKQPAKSPYQKQAEEWLKYARSDFLVAKDNFKLGHYSYVCQLCQQAAEKYLKAFLVAHGQEPKRTHILRELIADCSKLEPSLKELMPEAKELEQYYIPTRYPVGPFGVFGKKDAQAAISAAKRIIVSISRLLPTSKKPPAGNRGLGRGA